MSKKKSFTNLADLEKYIQTQFANNVWKNQGFRSVIAEEVSQAVVDVVYAAYEPEKYKRRDEDGLSEVDNVEVTDVKLSSKGVSVFIENLTEGGDSMKGRFITDLIEEGGTDGWDNANGIWTEPRPFIEETIDRLKNNPSKLENEVKKSLKGIGLDVK